MCRYVFHTYKPHYACFRCRKTFKRRLRYDIYNKSGGDTPAKCPDCGNLMADMGLDFKSPPKDDVKAWEHLSKLYQVGITFHSCGCSGVGYIPRDRTELLKRFEGTLLHYQKELEKLRENPENDKETREMKQHWIDNIKKINDRILWVKQNY